MRLFAERGVTAVSVRDIAQSADVSSSLVIHHYKSKEGLKAAVDERATATLVEVFADLVEGGPPEPPQPGRWPPGSPRTSTPSRCCPPTSGACWSTAGPSARRCFGGCSTPRSQTMETLQKAGVVRPVRR